MVSKTQKLDDLRLKYAGGILTPEDVRGLEPDEVLDLKASARYRSTIASIDKAASGTDTVVFDGSTEHRDRMGDVVRVHGRKGGKGWQTKNYERAGSPFLWAHDSSAPPVGRAVKLWRGKSSIDPSVPALKFEVDFHEDRDFPFANLVGRLFKSRRMTGSSVGFVISKSERYGSSAEREAAGLGPMGIEITEADLLELSGTPTPANPFALATGGKAAKGGLEGVIGKALGDLASEGGFSEAQIREFRETYPLGPDDAAERLRARVRGFVDFGGLALPEPSQVEQIATRAAAAIEASSTKADLSGVTRKSFDVDRQHLEAARLTHDWVSRWCGCEVKNLFNLDTEFGQLDAGSFLTGLERALKDFKIEDTRAITKDGREVPPSFESVVCDEKSSLDVLARGLQFRKGSVPIAVNYSRSWRGFEVSIWCQRDHAEVAQQILDDAWTWARENHFRRGKAFALSGKFLSPTEDTWDGVFLDAENVGPVKAAIAEINSKGAEATPRGMIWQGPPGTGKTLTARILRNQAKATFIWVSSRDVANFGSTGAILSAFDMARSFAPSVVLFEDVDTSFNSWTFDILKTELDGMERSQGVTTILTTNHPEHLPKALIDRPGRFHDVLQFDLPTREVRSSMFQAWSPKLSAKARALAVEKSEGMSGAHVRELCTFAGMVGEQDSLDADSAMSRAIAKLERQRELIGGNDSGQSAGWRSSKALEILTRGSVAPATDPEDEGKPKRPSKSADGDLIVPKAMTQRFADGLAAVQALAADADDLLDLLEGRAIEEPAPAADPEKSAGAAQPSEPAPETPAKDSTETLGALILSLVGELRADREERRHAEGGAAASEKDAGRPTPETDGEAQKATTAPEETVLGDEAVDSCIRSVRLARTSTPSDQ